MSLHSQNLNVDDSAPRRARTWVAKVLRGSVAHGGRWGVDVFDDAVLCASELVTAALIAHSRRMTLYLFIDRRVCRLSLIDDCPIVTDMGNPELRAQLQGLRLIDTVADGCGIEPAAGGRELWVVLRMRLGELTDPARSRGGGAATSERPRADWTRELRRQRATPA